MLAEAGEMDEADGEAPFRGVPIAVKDLTPTAGIRTTFSSRAYADFVPDYDTAVVRRLRDAGFVIVGKTNTPEFGTVAFTESDLNGATRNPWNLELTPGGSSGGAAAALAAALIPIAHGTDGGGSIRIPASCCGVFGLKPSRGRVSSAPFTSLEGLSTAGPLSRTVEDAAHLLDVLAGYEAGDPWWAPPPERPFAEAILNPPGRLRIAVTSTPPIDTPVAPRVRRRRSSPPPSCSSSSATRSSSDAALERARPLSDVHRGLAGRACPPSDRRPLVADGAQPWPRRVGASIDGDRLFEGSCASPERSRGERSRSGNEVDVVVTPTLAMAPVEIGWQDARRGCDRAAAPQHRVHPFHGDREPHGASCHVTAAVLE